MSADVTQIVKEGSNVLLKNAAGDTLKILNSQEIYAHPSAAPESNIIQFNNSPDRCAGNDSFYILVDKITVPAGPWDQQTLLQELSDNYINCPVIIDDWASLLAALAALLACCNEIDANTDEIEAKLDQQIALLTSLDAELTAQGLTLDSILIDTTAILADTTAIIAQLVTLNGVDFATQTTLAAVLADTTAIIAQLTTLNGVDFATQATLAALLAAFNAEDFATETTQAAIKAQTDLLTFTGPDLNVKASIVIPPITTGPVQFVKDAVNTEVEIDTATPADNEPLPVAIFNEKGLQGTGPNPLGVTAFDSQTASRQIVDLNGAAKFGEAIILVGDVFGSNTPSSLQWDTEFIGSGASNSQLGLQRIESGIVANSEARFQSVKKARFMLSQFNIFHCGLRIDNIADVDCNRRFGSFDPINPTQNGVYFAIIGGVWNVGYCINGVETLVTQAAWNGTNKDLFNPTPGLAAYEVHYNAGSMFFFQGPNFIHRISGLPSPYAATYHFNVAVEVININGNINNNGIDIYALGTYRLGEERGETISRVFGANTLIKSSAGYVKNAYLSRTGSGGGNANLLVYDGLDNTGALMARIDIGSDDVKGIAVESTFSEGLYIEITGTGTRNATISYE